MSNAGRGLELQLPGGIDYQLTKRGRNIRNTHAMVADPLECFNAGSIGSRIRME